MQKSIVSFIPLGLLILFSLFIFSPCAAETELSLDSTMFIESGEAEAETSSLPTLQSKSDFPPLNAQGFLDEGEFVFEDTEKGIWRYCSETLRIEIFRKEQDKPKEIWYEAEVWAANGEIFHMIPHDPEHRMSSLEYPYKIARENKTVLAVNSDFAHLRISQRSRPGILLRDGGIVSKQTIKSGSNTFPNLDTLALFPDGNMEVFLSDELDPEAYQTMGALDVLAFGPYLIRDGILNESGLKKYGRSNAQRTAVGMIEKGHYMVMMLEGRHSNSKGGPISFLAEKLLEKGCVNAMNLDGGQSSTILFMGKQICCVLNDYGRQASARKSAEILGIGQSESVADMDEKMSSVRP